MEGDFEKLAYEAALRSLDRQEALLEELRARTAVLLAASSLAASLLGRRAFAHPGSHGLTVVALAAFVVSMFAGVITLVPGRNLYFSMRGGGLYEGLYGFRHDRAEVYRRLAFDLDRFWKANDEKVQLVAQTYAVCAIAVLVEVFAMALAIADIFG